MVSKNLLINYLLTAPMLILVLQDTFFNAGKRCLCKRSIDALSHVSRRKQLDATLNVSKFYYSIALKRMF